jgi:hypothetical protein
VFIAEVVSSERDADPFCDVHLGCTYFHTSEVRPVRLLRGEAEGAPTSIRGADFELARSGCEAVDTSLPKPGELLVVYERFRRPGEDPFVMERRVSWAVKYDPELNLLLKAS